MSFIAPRYTPKFGTLTLSREIDSDIMTDKSRGSASSSSEINRARVTTFPRLAVLPVMSRVKIQSEQYGLAGFIARMKEREVDLLTNTLAVDSKKHQAETPVICKIRPEVILNKKARLTIFT